MKAVLAAVLLSSLLGCARVATSADDILIQAAAAPPAAGEPQGYADAPAGC